jgi:RHS repeat-associated protein
MQAAKEKMSTPVFSLAASAARTAITKSEGTNPIPQPDAATRFFKTNPTSGLARNSRLGHQLPTAVLYQGLGAAISNTATGFGDPLYDSHGRPRCTGKERDNETGLDFFESRYLSSAQGRFTSPDAPFAGQDPNNPQTWNLFSYGLNDPLRYSDPDGHEPCENGINPQNGNICTVVTPKKPGVDPGGVAAGIGKGLVNDFIGFTNLIDWMRQKSYGGPDFRQPLLPANNLSEQRGMVIATAGTLLLGGEGKLGDLTVEEIEAIQKVVNEAGRPLEVVGSAAKGSRGPMSDIDYVAPPSSHPYLQPLQEKLPGIDPSHGLVPGTHNPYMGPAIRFEPDAPPRYIPMTNLSK